MNENNFVRRVNYLSTGDGFRVCKPINLLADLRTSTGTALSTSVTAPIIAALETSFIGVQVASSTTFMGLFTWTVPDDYDAAADELRIRVACNFTGTNATDFAAGQITPTIYRKRPATSLIPEGATAIAAGLALSADLGCPATAADVIPKSTSFAAWVEMNCDLRQGNHELGTYSTNGGTTGAYNRTLASTADASIKPGDVLTISLASGAHTTDSINIYGIEIWYRSNLAFSDINAR